MASNGRKIERVPPLLLDLEKNDYIPQVVSMGPYYHGQSNLAAVEAFKPKAVQLFTLGGMHDEIFYYNIVHSFINEVRDCYVQTSDDDLARMMGEFSDDDLSRMMLRDASLIIIYMKGSVYYEDEMVYHLGLLTCTLMWRDFILVDNQIPLKIIKVLIHNRYGEGQMLLDKYIRRSIFRKHAEKARSLHDESIRGEPLHLLEAFHRVVVKVATPTPRVDDDVETGPVINGVINHSFIRSLAELFLCRKSRNSKRYYLNYSFRSVKDLKAKGIYFKPSPTLSLEDVNFRSHFFYSRLELPEWYVSLHTRPFFKNLVAYELSLNTPTMCEVASYINLMKSLIEGPGDVKELREKKILFNQLGSDEEVLNVYRDIDTHGVDNPKIFSHVIDEIEAHYNSRVKMWMAELFHNNFRSPWTAIAFLAAFSVLAISAAQLYYAMHPPPN